LKKESAGPRQKKGINPTGSCLGIKNIISLVPCIIINHENYTARMKLHIKYFTLVLLLKRNRKNRTNDSVLRRKFHPRQKKKVEFIKNGINPTGSCLGIKNIISLVPCIIINHENYTARMKLHIKYFTLVLLLKRNRKNRTNNSVLRSKFSPRRSLHRTKDIYYWTSTLIKKLLKYSTTY
jgi:hypothetical protein